MPFHLMKTYIRNSETETKLFLCPSISSDTDGCAADTSAHIYARGGFFSELGINGNLGWGIVGEGFFCFCQKNKNDNLGWKTLGGALRNHVSPLPLFKAFAWSGRYRYASKRKGNSYAYHYDLHTTTYLMD